MIDRARLAKFIRRAKPGINRITDQAHLDKAMESFEEADRAEVWGQVKDHLPKDLLWAGASNAGLQPPERDNAPSLKPGAGPEPVSPRTGDELRLRSVL
jgi:hypothetical protein